MKKGKSTQSRKSPNDAPRKKASVQPTKPTRSAPSRTKKDEGESLKVRDLIASDLKSSRRGFLAGDRVELFRTILRCAEWNVRLPDWAYGELREAYLRYTCLEVRTLDEAFGLGRRKGAHIGAEQDRILKALPVYDEICRRRKEGAPLTVETFQLAGKMFGVSAATARRYYELCKKTMPPTHR